jgi:hypothetical protein
LRLETPAAPLVRAGRGFDATATASIQKQSPTGLRRQGFCLNPVEAKGKKSLRDFP